MTVKIKAERGYVMKGLLFVLFAAVLYSVSYAVPVPHNVPALFRTTSGVEITSVEQWEKQRRPEILDFFSREVFGVRPIEAGERNRVSFKLERSDEIMGGKAIRKSVRVIFDGPQCKHSFVLGVYIPKSKKPVPAFVCIGLGLFTNLGDDGFLISPRCPVADIVNRGFALVLFRNVDIAADKNVGYDQGIYKAFKGSAQRNAESWATISAWAWGASRAMDWIETEPLIDSKKVAVIGHSRGGKTALWAGATDKRFAMTCSNDSGCSGAKLNHIRLPRSEDILQITKRFPYWFCENYKKYVKKEMSMPFDQHQLLALIAPRLLCVASATEDQWAGPIGEWWSAKLASPAWELYGKKGVVGQEIPEPDTPQQQGCVSYHLRTGRHTLDPYDWKCYMDFASSHGWLKRELRVK